MNRSIIIIGAGMGGLAAGIYGQKNGFDTVIFEAEGKPGGQCTGWKRNGYIFDACIHNFGGDTPDTKTGALWQDLGVLPCERVPTNEAISALFPDGTYIHDYNDPEKLEYHLKQISPEDKAVIDDYIRGIRSFQKKDTIGIMILGSFIEKVLAMTDLSGLIRFFKYTMDSFSRRFKHPALQKFFSLLHYSVPGVPFFIQLAKHAVAAKGGVVWPAGGSLTVSDRMAERYLQSGGNIRYHKKVMKILTDNDRACGIELEDGSVYKADYIVSNADGRKTIMQMLGGRYITKKISEYCKPNPDNVCPFAVMVFLGVKRDLSSLPSSLIVFLDKPEVIGGQTCDHLDLQIYGFDTSMAPAGKGVIKVELFGRPSYFSRLYNDKTAYNNEKNKIAGQVITLLEKQFKGLRKDIEVTDVCTLHTWERYMGGTEGFNNNPNKKFTILGDVVGLDQNYALPGLKNFFMTGQWVTSSGALIMNAISGKIAVQKICRQCGIKFKK